jgi:N-acylneuraminate cytidylyltransferase
MTCLAIILARKGSTGVPGKNVAPLGPGDRPCCEWTIDAALSASRVGVVALSTDDERAAAIARDRGIAVVDRPPELADATATIDAAARHAVEELQRRGTWNGGDREKEGKDTWGGIVILYANVPVRPAGLIDRALDVLERTGCDSVQSYAPVGKHHPWWTARVDQEMGRVQPWEGHTLNHGVHRRQDLPPAYVPDGGVIALTRRALFLEVAGVEPGPHAFFGLDRRGVVTGEGEVIDIDSPIDLLVADAVLRGT